MAVRFANFTGFSYRVSLALIALLSFLSCESYGNIQVANDTFRQVTVVNLKLLHRSQEAINSWGATQQIEATYSKKSKPGIQVPVEMKFIMDASETAELRSEAFVQLDAVAYEVNLTATSRSTNVHQKSSLPLIGPLRTTTEYKVFGTFLFSSELWQKMMRAQGLSYRIYVDQNPYTVRVSAEDIQKLRLFDRQ